MRHRMVMDTPQLPSLSSIQRFDDETPGSPSLSQNQEFEDATPAVPAEIAPSSVPPLDRRSRILVSPDRLPRLAILGPPLLPPMWFKKKTRRLQHVG